MASFFKERNLIKKWHALPVDAYKVAYDLAKEQFEDIMSENESLTNKSMKILTAFLLYVGFFVGMLINEVKTISQDSGKIWLLSVGAVCIIYISFLLVRLMLPKEIRLRGLAPSISIPHEFDDPEDSGFYQQKIYYNVLCILEESIARMKQLQKDRSESYQIALIGSLFLFVYIPAITVYILL